MPDITISLTDAEYKSLELIFPDPIERITSDVMGYVEMGMSKFIKQQREFDPSFGETEILNTKIKTLNDISEQI